MNFSALQPDGDIHDGECHRRASSVFQRWLCGEWVLCSPRSSQFLPFAPLLRLWATEVDKRSEGVEHLPSSFPQGPSLLPLCSDLQVSTYAIAGRQNQSCQGVQCSVLAGGFPEYQRTVREAIMQGISPNQAGLNLEHLRVIVVTGPDTLGRRQVVTELKESKQQLLDIEEVAVTNQQKGIGGDFDALPNHFF